MIKDVVIVSSAVIKSGTNNGRAWSLFKNTCQDGFEFTSFQPYSSGPVKVDVEERINGQYKNWSEVQKKKPNPDMEKVLTALSILNDKLDTILSWKK